MACESLVTAYLAAHAARVAAASAQSNALANEATLTAAVSAAQAAFDANHVLTDGAPVLAAQAAETAAGEALLACIVANG